MPRTKEQFEEMRNATREKIQSAGMQLFVEKGFGSANVQAIADQAGISIGLFYRHYKTKEDLLHELVQFALAGLQQIIERFQSDESPKKLIHQLIEEVYEDMVSGYDLAYLMTLMSQAFISKEQTDEKQNEVVDVNQNLLHAASELIKDGQHLGEFAAGDSYEMAAYLFAMIQGLAGMKVMLKNNFVMPSTEILTAFLYKKGE